MKIYIEYLGKIKKIKINPTDTIKDIKLKIRDEKGIPLDYQNLYFNEQNLDNKEKITYYNIKNYSVLNLVIKPKRIIIFIKSDLSREITLDPRVSDTIENIKKEIENKEKIPKAFQILKFNNTILDDNKTLKDYNIPNNSVIELILKYYNLKVIKIYIELLDLRKLCINAVYKYDKIIAIKEKIKHLTDIPISVQQLYFNDEILDDDKTIDFYKIKEKSIIKLFSKTISILINNDEKIKLYEVRLTDKIDDLKKKIEEKENLSLNNKELVFQNQTLQNDKTLAYYNIQNESVLYTRYIRNIFIFIKFPYSQIILKVSPYDTIKNIKRMILAKICCRLSDINYGGIILENEYTLTDYNIQNNSTIFA